jgi:hypothetical protein
MSTSAERSPAPEQAQPGELRPEAIAAVNTIHETIKSWAPESEYTLTDNAAEFPVLFGRCTVSVTPLGVDTWDGYSLSERIEARTELSYVIDDFEERQDVEALHRFYVPTLLWSSVVQSFAVQQALRVTFGTDLLGEQSEQIGMPGCDEPTRWRPEDFAWAKELLRENEIYSNASETGLTAEFPWEPGAVSAIAGDITCLLQLNS